ncbi:MAG: hypothetical protein Q4B04_01410 [bacterium]|nr:hypothetical protein [bacterium]
MTAILEPNGKLKVRLNKEEADYYKVYDIIFNYNEMYARAHIVKILVKAARKTGAYYFTGNFVIEIFSMSDGGFLISFLPEKTDDSKKNCVQKKGMGLQKFSFESSEALLECIRQLMQHKEIYDARSSVYFHDESYSLIIRLKDSNAELLIKEYAAGATKNSSDILRTMEYGRLVWKDNAISKLANIFYKDLSSFTTASRSKDLNR